MSVYIRLKKKWLTQPGSTFVCLGDIGEVWPEDMAQRLCEVKFMLPPGQPDAVIDSLEVIRRVTEVMPDESFTLLGEDQVLIEIEVLKSKSKPLLFLKGIGLVIFFFIGAATAVLNFHSDVGMAGAHRILFKAITGREVDFAPILSIPYSIGLGVGMSLFFMRTKKMKRRGEPDALHVKMDQYEDEIDTYRQQRIRSREEGGQGQ